MGVTSIRRIENRSTNYLRIFNVENQKQYGTIEPGTYFDTNLWIPWAASNAEWRGHHLNVELRPAYDGYPIATFAIWQANRQDGDHVRISSPPQYWDSGHQVSGTSTVNGDRRLIVTDAAVEVHGDFPTPDLPGGHLIDALPRPNLT